MNPEASEARPSLGWGRIVAPRAPQTAPSSNTHYPELDGHRGLAIVGIVIFHAYQFSNTGHYLYLGTPAYTILNSLDAMVPWFFVISAFVLFEPFAHRVIDGQNFPSMRDFITRRALRLIPIYYVAILVVWLLRQPTLPGDWVDLIEHLTFTQVFDEKRIFYTIGPGWSVAVAMYFYVVLALFAWGMSRVLRPVEDRRTRIGVLLGGTVALAVLCFGWKAWSFGAAHHPTGGSFTTWFGPLASLDSFAVGMAVATLVAAVRHATLIGPRVRAALRVTGTAILIAAFTNRGSDSWTGAYFGTFCSIGFGFLVVAAVAGPPRDQWARALSWRPLRFLGEISLSIYVWHEPVMLALRGPHGLVHEVPSAFVPNAITVLVVSIVVGWASYVAIERPTARLAMNMRRHRERAPLPPRGSTLAEVNAG